MTGFQPRLYQQNLMTVGFLFDDSGQSVALTEKKYPDWQNGLWNGIGGKVRHDEYPDACQIREFLEETGVNLGDWQVSPGWENIVTIHGDQFTLYVYRAFSTEAQKALAPSVAWPSEEPVKVWPVQWALRGYDGMATPTPIPIIPDLKWLLPLCQDRSIQAGYLRHHNVSALRIVERR